MTYELWDEEGANLVTSFDSEATALNFVRRTVQRHGRTEATSWVLLRADEGDNVVTVAAGDELIERALALAA